MASVSVRCRIAGSLSLAFALATVAGTARADEIVVQGLTAQKVTLTDFKDGKLIYQTARGDQNDREFERVKQIVVDGETALNDAEKAYAAEDKAASVDNYIKAIRSASKPWIKGFAAKRLLDAIGPDSKRFDAKLAAYFGLLLTAPDEASTHKPTLPEKGNRFLETAVSETEASLKLPNLSESQTLALLNFLIEIHRQRGDDAAVATTVERMARSSQTASNDPAIKAQLANLKVTQAKLALDQKKFSDAAKLVNDNRAFITEPRAQSDALYILAQANFATVNKADKTALSDAALMFMRVVANFGDLEGRPNVLQSLQATGEILKQIGDKPGAIAVFDQITREFPNDPAAKAAKTEVDSLKKE